MMMKVGMLLFLALSIHAAGNLALPQQLNCFGVFKNVNVF